MIPINIFTMKDLLMVLFLILTLFALAICYGLGMYTMFKMGWHKSFYLALCSIFALLSLVFMTRHFIKNNSKK